MKTPPLTDRAPEPAAVDPAPPARARVSGWSEQLQAMARVVSREATDLEGAGAFVLECLLESLGFDRGFVLIDRPRNDHGEERDVREEASGAAPAYEIVMTRLARVDGEEIEWSEVPQPGYALQIPVVKSAFASTEVISTDTRSRAEGAAHQRRAVLCQSFPLGDSARGLIYLERRLGLEDVGRTQIEAFSAFVDWCAPAFGRTYLEREVAKLRRELETSGDSGDEDAESEDDANEVSIDTPTSLPDVSEIPPAYHGIIGADEKMRRVAEIAEKVKDSELNICIFGESGTGKELVARAIHAAGSRRDRAFVSENCGAISETLLESELFGHVKGAFTGAEEDRQGLFELADKGTLFLDEIGDMSEGMQRKLLRALQEGVIRPIGSKSSIHVDVRVISASNRDLKQLVESGAFRADLYYRLNVITIQVPPLRDRRADIPFLLSHFAREVEATEGIRRRFSPSALKALCLYGWPGNVRELRNVVRRVLLTATRRSVARKDVLPYLRGGTQGAACLGENLSREDDRLVLRIPVRESFNDIVEECERLVLLSALRENGWNKSRVTKVLGIPRQSLYNKIARFGLTKPSE